MPLRKRWSDAQEGKKGWKANYFEKLLGAMRTYSKFLLVSANNVSSKQFADIRMALRGDGLIIMGKNTMMKKVIRNNIQEFPEYEKVLPMLVGNVGFLFTNGDLKAMRDKIAEFKVRAPARAGAVSQVDVIIEPHNTGFGPDKTSFFQSLQIMTKINRGTVEIVSPVHILKPGETVGASEATLLNMLKMSPFTYGLVTEQCFDEGSVFEPAVLDITESDIRKKFMAGVTNIACVSLNIGYPTLASAPHSMANAFKRLVALTLSTGVMFPEAAKLKDRIENPGAYAASAPVAAVAEGSAAPAAKAEEEEAEESEASFGGDMFGGADDDSSDEDSSEESSD